MSVEISSVINPEDLEEASSVSGVSLPFIQNDRIVTMNVTQFAQAIYDMRDLEVFCTQAEYDALVRGGTVDENIKYYIYEE